MSFIIHIEPTWTYNALHIKVKLKYKAGFYDVYIECVANPLV